MVLPGEPQLKTTAEWLALAHRGGSRQAGEGGDAGMGGEAEDWKSSSLSVSERTDAGGASQLNGFGSEGQLVT